LNWGVAGPDPHVRTPVSILLHVPLYRKSAFWKYRQRQLADAAHDGWPVLRTVTEVSRGQIRKPGDGDLATEWNECYALLRKKAANALIWIQDPDGAAGREFLDGLVRAAHGESEIPARVRLSDESKLEETIPPDWQRKGDIFARLGRVLKYGGFVLFIDASEASENTHKAAKGFVEQIQANNPVFVCSRLAPWTSGDVCHLQID
jgi:hypothetical protein